MSGLSLFTIEQALTDLLAAREELLAGEGFDVSEDARHERVVELAEVEKALAEYVTKEIRKVDGIHFYLAAAKQAHEAAKLEAQRMTERARRIDESSKRLKALCCDVMVSLDKKRLDGTAGRYLLRKGNGGLQKVEVDGWDDEARSWKRDASPVLPNEYRDLTVTLPYNEWLGLVEACKPHARSMKTEPANARIRAALAEGHNVPGARLAERGEHVEIK